MSNAQITPDQVEVKFNSTIITYKVDEWGMACQKCPHTDRRVGIDCHCCETCEHFQKTTKGKNGYRAIECNNSKWAK